MKLNRELEKKLSEKQKEVQRREQDIATMDGAARQKEIDTQKHYNYAMQLQREQESLIEREGARLIDNEKNRLQNLYEILASKTQKELDKEYKKKKRNSIPLFVFIS